MQFLCCWSLRNFLPSFDEFEEVLSSGCKKVTIALAPQTQHLKYSADNGYNKGSVLCIVVIH